MSSSKAKPPSSYSEQYGAAAQAGRQLQQPTPILSRLAAAQPLALVVHLAIACLLLPPVGLSGAVRCYSPSKRPAATTDPNIVYASSRAANNPRGASLDRLSCIPFVSRRLRYPPSACPSVRPSFLRLTPSDATCGRGTPRLCSGSRLGQRSKRPCRGCRGSAIGWRMCEPSWRRSRRSLPGCCCSSRTWSA